MNIVFSTTRQWNPGDEFILLGCINLLKQHIDEFNAIIYNRNPQIRPSKKFSIINMVGRWLGKEVGVKFLDNSVKDYLPMDYADLVVFAGSPEWKGRRTRKLYADIEKYDIPVIFLGLGSSMGFRFNSYHFSKQERSVLKRSLLITTRDALTKDNLKPLPAHLLPCPALFSSKFEKKINIVKKIGLIYGSNKSVKHNNISDDTHSYITTLYKNLISEFKGEYQFEFILHYIDEIQLFKNDFSGDASKYSYDSKDYIDIYSNYDLVIGHRVHGIGISASMGIPGIMISHDKRSETTKGFQAEQVSIGTEYDAFKEIFLNTVKNINFKNEQLIKHKSNTLKNYLELISDVLK